jgi:hypothetical protein
MPAPIIDQTMTEIIEKHITLSQKLRHLSKAGYGENSPSLKKYFIDRI